MTYIRITLPSLTAALMATALLGLSACQPPASQTDATSAVEAADETQRYTVRGRIAEMPSEAGTVMIEHEAIPGYMAAMTMPFTANNPAELEGLAPGDAVQFEYIVVGTSQWITRVQQLPSDAVAEHPAAADAPEYVEPSDASLYQLAATWTNQNGEAVPFDALRGRPVVLSMIFTNCTYACPMIVHDMKQIAAALPDALRDEAQYVLVSMDPDRDTPAALRRFATAHGLDLSSWTLLEGTKRDVRLLAALLGIRYKPEADGQFSHTNLITILNPDGEIMHQQRGLGGDSTPSATTLHDVLVAQYEAAMP